jgi:hypothetical protein
VYTSTNILLRASVPQVSAGNHQTWIVLFCYVMERFALNYLCLPAVLDNDELCNNRYFLNELHRVLGHQQQMKWKLRSLLTLFTNLRWTLCWRDNNSSFYLWLVHSASVLLIRAGNRQIILMHR